MQIDERYGYITCSCGEKLQALKEFHYQDERGQIIVYIDSDDEGLKILYEEHLLNCHSKR